MKKIAAVILENQENQILLFLRDDKPTIPFPNTRDLIGGHVDEGETIDEALQREIQEEINIRPQSTFFKQYNCPADRDVYPNIKYIYRAHIDTPLEKLELYEGQRLAYFSYDQVAELPCANMIKDILLDYITYRNHEKN